MTLLLALSLLSTAHAQTVETIGGDFTYNNDSDAVKLDAITVAKAVVITQSEFQVAGERGSGAIFLVLYKRTKGTDAWTLVDSVAPPTPPPFTNDAVYASSGPVEWLLLPGETYGVGAYVGEGWYYYYTQFGPETPSFGRLAGSARVSDAAPPATFNARLENFFYQERLTFVSADVDGDGLIAQQYGGDDCDDTNAELGAVTDEIPYDGLDQDCDGADLTDVDADGANGVDAGGKDCDDADATINPKAAEVCGDGIDQDCAGGDLDCADVTDTDLDGLDSDSLTDDGERIVAGGCACDTRGGSGGALVALAALAVARRRRRA